MKLSAPRETVLKTLQTVIGVVERRQTMPILANVLLQIENQQLVVTGTDLEVELVARSEPGVEGEGQITVAGRKLLDICRALPAGAEIRIEGSGEKATLRSGKSRFSLTTLPASDFPRLEDVDARQALRVPAPQLRRLLEKTHFSMAQQDVRYYLNGMLLETDGKVIRAVATDGHRLALCETELETPAEIQQQVIVPRKGVLELQRLLDGEGEVEIRIGNNHLLVFLGDVQFTSKLIDGRFPDYGRVIPSNAAHQVVADRQALHEALRRTAILSNEKYRGIRLVLESNLLTVQAHNPEQEEAEEQLEISYDGPAMEIGFNVTYLQDALGAIDCDEIQLNLMDANSSCVISASEMPGAKFVVMPMRL